MKKLFGMAGAVLAALVATGAGCSKDNPNQLGANAGTSGDATTTGTGCPMGGDSTGVTTGSGSTTGTGKTGSGATGGGPVTPTVPASIADRVVSYTEALRTASFKLVGDAPSLAQIRAMAGMSPAAQATYYGQQIDAMMSDPRFSAVMIQYWQETMRQAGPANGSTPSRDTAPTFAARLTVEKGRRYTDLFTANTNTCPTFDGTKFVDGSCSNGPITAGILTDPGVQAQYFSNFAFRRVRFFQEVFVCRAQPAELSKKPIKMGAGDYTSPWPFSSIAGKDNGGRIDFHDTSSAVCANCHTTSNHRAPLFADFDMNGQYQGKISVLTPLTGNPVAMMTDWLPPGEGTAWKYKVPAADIGQLGAAMAQDAEVQACAVARMWNYAMSKGDIVNDVADVPTSVIQTVLQHFVANNFNLNATVREIFLHDDFVRF